MEAHWSSRVTLRKRLQDVVIPCWKGVGVAMPFPGRLVVVVGGTVVVGGVVVPGAGVVVGKPEADWMQ